MDLLFPKWCVGCRREGAFICQSCYRSLSRVMPPLCPKCGRPQPSGILCSECVGWQAEVDGIRAPFQFEGIIRQAVHQFKYQNLRAMAGTLARLLYDYFIDNPLPVTVLVPVPLHEKRLRERGYNQSALLAREFGRLVNLPVVEDCLVRRRHTAPQARTSSVAERLANVAGAFICRNDALKGQPVLLIDDVATSGSTLAACAAVAKAGSAMSVWGLVVAREI